MIGTGIYDLTTHGRAGALPRCSKAIPATAAYELRQYEGGHMAYTNEAALKAITGDVRAFVSRK